MGDVDQQFPYVVSTGISRLFRVRHMGVGRYQVEQKIKSTTKGEPTKWQVLAISNHLHPQEAIGVMEADQRAYYQEIQKRQSLAKAMTGKV